MSSLCLDFTLKPFWRVTRWSNFLTPGKVGHLGRRNLHTMLVVMAWWSNLCWSYGWLPSQNRGVQLARLPLWPSSRLNASVFPRLAVGKSRKSPAKNANTWAPEHGCDVQSWVAERTISQLAHLETGSTRFRHVRRCWLRQKRWPPWSTSDVCSSGIWWFLHHLWGSKMYRDLLICWCVECFLLLIAWFIKKCTHYIEDFNNSCLFIFILIIYLYLSVNLLV